MIIGLNGWSRAGKDTIGAHLVENHGFVRVSFADAIRELLEEIDLPVGSRGLKEHVLEVGWDHYKMWGDGTRLLINTGNGLRKVFGGDILLAAAAIKIDHLGKTVITDVRHPNEAQWVADYSGFMVRVNRPGAVPAGMDRLLDTWPFDAVIANEEGIPDLHRKVDRALEHLCRSSSPSPRTSSTAESSNRSTAPAKRSSTGSGTPSKLSPAPTSSS